jgi:branched-chain amino acid transport system permease protein
MLISGILLTFVPTLLIKHGVINVYWAQILTVAGINAILAISVNTITGITGQLSLGQAGFLAIGAYTCISFTLDLGIPLPVSAILAGLAAALAGFLIGLPTLRLNGDYLAIATLGFGEIIRVILTNLRSITGGANGRQFITALSPIQFTYLRFFIVTASLVILLLLLQNFLHSTYGRAILAVREDEIAANSSGIGVFRYKMVGFVTAAFLAGIGGALYAVVLTFVKPDIASFTKSIDFLIFVVLGGMGSMTGSIIAAYVLSFLQEFLRFLESYRLIIYPLILILVMLYRPQGLFGMKEFSFSRLYDKIIKLWWSVKYSKHRIKF